MTKLEKAVRNYGKDYSITIATLRKYQKEGLIYCNIYLDELEGITKNYKVTMHVNYDGVLIIDSDKVYCRYWSSYIEDERLLTILKEVQAGINK